MYAWVNIPTVCDYAHSAKSHKHERIHSRIDDQENHTNGINHAQETYLPLVATTNQSERYIGMSRGALWKLVDIHTRNFVLTHMQTIMASAFMHYTIITTTVCEPATSKACVTHTRARTHEGAAMINHLTHKSTTHVRESGGVLPTPTHTHKCVTTALALKAW